MARPGVAQDRFSFFNLDRVTNACTGSRSAHGAGQGLFGRHTKAPLSLAPPTVMICATAEDAATTGRTIAARAEKIPLYFRIDTFRNCWLRHPNAHRLRRGYFGYFFIRSDQERAYTVASKCIDTSSAEFLSLRATENNEPFHAHFPHERMRAW